jgi:adenylate kinase
VLEELIVSAELLPPVNPDAPTEEEQKRLNEVKAARKELDMGEEMDEVDQLIQREIDEHARNQSEKASRELAETEAAKERKIREEKEAAKLENIRQQERDLLDTRSQPIRQYLMDNVVPYLTEGLIDLCKRVPENPTDYLANFLLEKADLIDEKFIKDREEEAKRKAEERSGFRN